MAQLLHNTAHGTAITIIEHLSSFTSQKTPYILPSWDNLGACNEYFEKKNEHVKVKKSKMPIYCCIHFIALLNGTAELIITKYVISTVCKISKYYVLVQHHYYIKIPSSKHSHYIDNYLRNLYKFWWPKHIGATNSLTFEKDDPWMNSCLTQYILSQNVH